MKTMIVEDDFISRKILKEILTPYGDCDIAIDGEEAVQAFRVALEENTPYDLVCMDILMPKMDGQEALKMFRAIEKVKGVQEKDGVKVVMISALDDPKSVIEAFYQGGATAYLVKPVVKQKLLQELKNFGLIR